MLSQSPVFLWTANGSNLAKRKFEQGDVEHLKQFEGDAELVVIYSIAVSRSRVTDAFTGGVLF